MLSRRAVVALLAALGGTGCATMTPEEVARAQELNHRAWEQAQQAGQLAAQQANQTMLMILAVPTYVPPPTMPAPMP